MSAVSARSVSQTEGLDPSRALQRVLYRSAKQDPQRRFHALYHHVARSDILWRAWGDVRANRGAPGVDGVTIDAVEQFGVPAFLDDLAEALRAGMYRPAPLRRGVYPQARAAGPDQAAVDPVCSGSGGDGGCQDRPRTDLRGRFLAGEFRVSPETVGPYGL
jgi:hypothetical protein